jgi:hypothetical protein
VPGRNNPAFDVYLDSPEAVEAVNEQAYLTSLNLLINSFTFDRQARRIAAAFFGEE